MLKRLIVVAAVLATMGCGSSGEPATVEARETTTTPDTSEWCGNVEVFVKILNSGNFRTEPDVRAFIGALSKLKNNPPAAVADDLKIAYTADPDTIKLSEATKRREAVTTVDRYIQTECDLRTAFADKIYELCFGQNLNYPVVCT